MQALFKKAIMIGWAMGIVMGVVYADAATVGDPAPDFRLPSLSGEEMALESFKGQVVLLNFWASWCDPCKQEMPEFEKIHQKYHDRGFQVVGINIDKKKENAQMFADYFHVNYPVLLDPESATIQRYLGRSMPTSYIIDRTGRVREVIFGFNRAKLPKIEETIGRLLDEPAK